MFVQQFEHVNDSDGFNVPQLGHGTVLIETSSPANPTPEGDDSEATTRVGFLAL
jgi:hypothetical protein